MAYTPHAQVVEGEEVYGRYRDPSEKELVVIEAYRATYLQAFGVEPAGTHWIDGVRSLVSLLREGGIPGPPDEEA
jgi:hypothetical protein